MELIHVEDHRWSTPSEVIECHGPAHLPSNKPCYIDLGEDTERIALTRRLAMKAGNNDLKIFTKWRPDIFMCHQSTTIPPDFDPEWILQSTQPNDRKIRMDIHREWEAAGYTIDMEPSVDMVRWNHFATGRHIPYCKSNAGDPESKSIVIYGMLCDLRREDYRAYSVAHCKQICDQYSLDGVFTSCKMGWMSNGSPALMTPESEVKHGGPLYTSPYGPGEFEAAYSALIRELAAEDIYQVISCRPNRPEYDDGDTWGWMDEDVKSHPLGEYI